MFLLQVDTVVETEVVVMGTFDLRWSASVVFQ